MKIVSPPAPPASRPPQAARRKQLVWWGIVGAYAAAVFVVSVIPINVDVNVPYLDKGVHVCEYLLFAWLLVQAVRATRMPERDYLLWAWIYATSYGILIEIVQAMIPWRSAEVADAVANAVGAACGVWIGERIPRTPFGSDATTE